ncbi:hypothetical protein A3Q56_06835 [Intoshia linei]|uniref:Integrase catalytic domain-containing protein n=1 Tax=Intoshia linei TaxID=1819745 RepID=A0A177AV90_9BILA|nr:hypothetical protein A3Q56_06835 [Intoshia linei]
MVDHFTSWPEAIPITDITKETISMAIVNNIIARHGVPNQLHTDNGTQFESELVKEISRHGVPNQLHTDNGTQFESELVKEICRQSNIKKRRAKLIITKDKKNYDKSVPNLTSHNTKYYTKTNPIKSKTQRPYRKITKPSFLKDYVMTFKNPKREEKKINIALLNILKSSCYRKIYYEVRINEIVKTKNCNSKDGFFFRVGWASEEHFIPHYYSGSNNNDLAIGDSFYSCGFDGNNIWIGGNSIQIKDIKELHNNSTIGVYLNLDNKIIKFSIDGCIIEDFYINQLCNWTRLAPFISYSDNVKFTINYHNINTKNKDLSYLALNDISSIIELDSVLLLNNEIKFSKYITIENIARFSQNSHTIIQNFDLNNYSLSENINKLVQDLAIDLHNFWVINKIEQGWRYGKMNEQEKKHPSLISYLDTEKEHKNYHFNLSKNLIKLIFYAGFTISKQCSKLLKYGFVELHNGKINISMDTLNKYDIDQKPMHKKNEDKEKYIYLITDHIDLNKNLIILANIISEYLHNEWCHSQINDGWKYSSVSF